MHKILVFKSGLLGDTLVATPALHCLRDSFPDSHIVYVYHSIPGKGFVAPTEVLAGSGLVDEFYNYELASSRPILLFNYLKLWLYCVTCGFNIGIVLEPPYWSSRRKRFLRLCGINTVIGPDGLESKITRNSNASLPVVDNIVDSLVSVLSPLNIDLPLKGNGRFDVVLSDLEKERGRQWLSQRGFLPTGPERYLVIAPGSNMASKRWSLDNYLLVVNKLISKYDVIPIVVGGKEDVISGDYLVNRWNVGLNAAGKLSIRDGISVMSQCRLYLGNDTGSMHMAVAAGLPCVAIFSSIDMPGRWNPYGSRHQILREDIECAGCMLRDCMLDSDSCIDKVLPEAVFSKCASYFLE